MLTPSIATFIAGEAIPAGARVKFSTYPQVVLADASEGEIGTAILHSGKSAYASGDEVGVALLGHPGTRTCIANGTIAAGAAVFRDVDGTVDDDAAGEFFGYSCEAVTAGKKFEVLHLPVGQGPGVRKVARAIFDPGGDATMRTIGAHGLGIIIPDKAIITDFFWEVNTTFTSATDAATIAYHANAANDLLSAIAISDATNVHDAGRRHGLPGLPNLGADTAHDTQAEVAALFAATFVKLTADRELTATVAVEALTAGKATLFVEYVQGA